MKLNRTASNWTELERNKINENWDIIEGSYNSLEGEFDNVIGTITDEVVGHLIDSAKLIWKEPVDTFEDLPASAEVGETRMVREADPEGISYVYRYDGEKWEKIQAIDVTLVNEVDRRLSAQLADIAVNIKEFGAKGDLSQDETHIIQSAYNSLKEGQTLLINGDYLITNLVFDRPNISIEVVGSLVQKNEATGVAVTLGSNGQTTKNINGTFSILKEGVESATNFPSDSTGLKLINLHECNISINNLSGFETGLLMEGDGEGLSYNNIYITAIINNKTSILFNTKNNGWTNENKFYGGRFTWNTRFYSVEGKRHVVIPVDDMNQNIFFSPSFEGANGLFVDCYGRFNSFINPRMEGATSNFINFREGSMYNTLYFPFISTMSEPKVINNGTRNTLMGLDLIDAGVIKGSNATFRGAGVRHGTEGHGVVDATNTSSKHYNVYVGRDTSGDITSSVTGSGEASYKKIIAKNSSPNERVFEAGTDDGIIFSMFNSGVIDGRVVMSKDYVNNHFIAHSVIDEVPSEHPGRTGVLVFNTSDEKLYIHVGRGVWKKLAYVE